MGTVYVNTEVMHVKSYGDGGLSAYLVKTREIHECS